MTVYSQQYFNEGVSAVTAAPSVDVGMIRTVGPETYRYCYNTGSSTIGVGFGAVLSSVAGYSVTVSSVTSVDFLVGVCKHVAIPTGSYGWLMTRGFSRVVMGADNSGAVGNMLELGTDGAFASVSNTTGNKGPTVGKLMSAIASAGSGMAYISVF